MNIQLNIPNLLKFKLGALIVLIDFDYSRLCIASYEIQQNLIVLWLEDQHDMVNSLASCLRLEVPLENLVPIVSPDDVPLNTDERKRQNMPGRYSEKVIQRTVNWFTKVAPAPQRKTVLEILLTSMMNQVMDDRKNPVYA